MRDEKTNTTEEDALEAWAASDEREIRPDAAIWKGTPESRAEMRRMLDATGRREYQWLNHPDDIAEARRRQELKRSGLFGWLKVTLSRQRIPKRPPNTALDHKMNRTSDDEHVLNDAQWNFIADHFGAERIT